jgi:hypothetical protein
MILLLFIIIFCLKAYSLNRFIERRCLNRAFNKAKHELNNACTQTEKNKAQAEFEVLQVLLTVNAKKLVKEREASQ